MLSSFQHPIFLSPEEDQESPEKRLKMIVPIVLGVWLERHVPKHLKGGWEEDRIRS